MRRWATRTATRYVWDAGGLAAVAFCATGCAGRVTSPEADVYLARDGRIVAVLLPKDLVGKQVSLAPGASEVFDARGSARDCATDGALAPGRYEIYARVALTTDDGTSVAGIGGPWPLEVA